MRTLFEKGRHSFLNFEILKPNMQIHCIFLHLQEAAQSTGQKNSSTFKIIFNQTILNLFYNFFFFFALILNQCFRKSINQCFCPSILEERKKNVPITYEPNELLKRMCEAWLLRKEYFGCGKQIIRG